MHTLMFSRSLDTDSTALSLFERGVDGGFVAVKCAALPLSVAVCRMACHGIAARMKGKLNCTVLLRCLHVLHRVVYHNIHGVSDAAAPDASGTGVEHALARAHAAP